MKNQESPQGSSRDTLIISRLVILQKQEAIHDLTWRISYWEKLAKPKLYLFGQILPKPVR